MFFWVISTYKPPTETQNFCEPSTPGTEPQTYDDLKRFSCCQMSGPRAATLSNPTNSTQPRFTTRQNSQHSRSSQCGHIILATFDAIRECCNGTYIISAQKLRISLFLLKKLCVNSLKAGHRQQDCRGKACRQGNLKRHTFIHLQSSRPTRSVKKQQ